SAKKNGPPANAVTTPTGTSAGDSAVRANTSASTMKAAPHTNASGNSRRWAGPNAIRTACGVMRPTNPMMPATLTAAAVTRVANTNNASFTRSTGNPNWAAPSSPSWSTSRARAKAIVAIAAGAVKAATTATSFQDAKAKLPSKRANTPAACSCAPRRTKDVAAVRIEPTTTPARIRRTVGNDRPSRANAVTSNTVASAATNAANGAPTRARSGTPAPRAITSVAPNPAPLAVPIRYGSAKELRNTPWKTAPANANP